MNSNLTPSTSDPAFADHVLRLAREVEAAESAIKAEILRAARAGDCRRVIHVMSRWASLPAAEVLESGESAEHNLIDSKDLR